MARHKIGVIGGGFVGSTTAQRIAEKELGDVVLFVGVKVAKFDEPLIYSSCIV